MYKEHDEISSYYDYNGYDESQSYQRYGKSAKKKNPKIFMIVLALLIIGGIGSAILADGEEKNTDESSLVPDSSTTDEQLLKGQVSVEPNTDLQTDELSYYYYNQLSSKDKTIYDTILNAMLNMDAKVQIEETDKDILAKINEAIMADHPELFWCDGVYTYTIYDNYTEYSPNYLYGEWEKNSRQKEIGIATNNFLQQINESMSDYEKVKAVFEYVVESVEYVTGAPDNQNIYGSLVNRKCVCAGYTRASQYLLQQLGIECLYVSGMVDGTESHSWNIMKCDGKYYQMDSTFGDKTFDSGIQPPEELKINYSYLCCTDKEIYTNHNVDMSFVIPICNSNDLSYYKMQGVYYIYYSQEVLDDLEQAISNGGKVWQCQFSNQQDYLKMLSDIENGVFSDIVGNYYTNMGYIGTWTSWHVVDEDMYTIACWY